MSWLVLSLIALFCFVIYDVSGRYFATRSENPQVFSVIYNATLVLLSPLIFLVDHTMPGQINWPIVGVTSLGLLVWGVFGRYEYFAKKHVEASTLSIVGKLDIILNFCLVLIFLKESLTLHKILGMVLIITVNIILFYGNARKSIISDKGLKYAIILSFLLALGWLFDTINVKSWGVGTFAILTFVSPVVIGCFFPTIHLKQLKRELVLTPYWQFVALASANFVGYALMLKALTFGPASNVMPIVTSGSPFIVLLGYLFLGEKDHPYRKLVAASLSVLAIYLMR